MSLAILLIAKPPALLYKPSIHIYCSAVSQILYHIPVDGRFLFSARILIRPSHSQMDCAANLFIKQNVFRKMLYAVVCANADLTEISCASIWIKHCNKKVLVFFCRCLYYLPLFKLKPNTQNLFTLIYGRQVIIDFAFSRVFNRRQKHLSVRHIPLAKAWNCLSPFYANCQVSIFSEYSYYTPFIQDPL